MEFIYVFIGVCIGLLVSIVIQKIRSVAGTLKVDHSNPKKDIYMLEIDKLDDLTKKKKVIFKVDHNADLS